MLEVRNLSKNYGNKRAVKGISFSVGKGEILGFLGPNGAGESTTMNMITGYLASSEGEILVDGINVLEEPLLAKKKIGYLPEKPPLYQDMSVEEYLNFVFDLKKASLPRKEHLKEVCSLVGIEHVRSRLIKNLSKGYQQRVGIAQALLGYPPLLILDEPMVGLDPKQIVEIRDLIAQLGKKQTIILSTHILPEVQSICKRIIVINQGELVADGEPDTLMKEMDGTRMLRVAIAAPEQTLKCELESLEGVVSVECTGLKEDSVYGFLIEQAEGEDVRIPLFNLMAERHWPIMELSRHMGNLEDLFLKLTAQEKKEA